MGLMLCCLVVGCLHSWALLWSALCVGSCKRTFLICTLRYGHAHKALPLMHKLAWLFGPPAAASFICIEHAPAIESRCKSQLKHTGMCWQQPMHCPVLACAGCCRLRHCLCTSKHASASLPFPAIRMQQRSHRPHGMCGPFAACHSNTCAQLHGAACLSLHNHLALCGRMLTSSPIVAPPALVAGASTASTQPSCAQHTCMHFRRQLSSLQLEFCLHACLGLLQLLQCRLWSCPYSTTQGHQAGQLSTRSLFDRVFVAWMQGF